jgi:hypothetical protein
MRTLMARVRAFAFINQALNLRPRDASEVKRNKADGQEHQAQPVTQIA